MIFAFFVI